jgi:lipoprotein-anchoring transpeptidase ErfK/SrfK
MRSKINTYAPRIRTTARIFGNSARGCIRMINQDAIDLYQRTPVGNKVVVLASRAG